MLFNSVEFAIFLPVVFLLYWFATRGKYRLQNILLLFSSYYFYSCWSKKFLLLLIFSTLLDYFSGLKMSGAKSKREKTFWFWLSIGINLGFLGVFKYYNFFVTSFAEAVHELGFQANVQTLHFLLPVGISFYTFHGLSYVIDIYKERIQPEKNFIDYAVFVCFFPLLVAGPIERATHLLPQIKSQRVFQYPKAVDGLRQILWGLFKKIVIADNCAVFANAAFNDSANQSGGNLFLGALFFTFQIYGDFSGYSDIALGTARLFGIELLRNFAYPYFSRDIAEFWRRWHISLSTWFKDYLYIPLGGSKGGTWTRVRNTFIIFLVSGFWHGANWTFIAWGFLNALFILPSILFSTNRININIVAQGRYLPDLKEFSSILFTFCLTVFAWIFFRADSLGHAFQYIGSIWKDPASIFSIHTYSPFKYLIALILIFIVVEWTGRENPYAIARTGFSWPRLLRWNLYLLIGLVIFFYGNFNKTEFIYFAF